MLIKFHNPEPSLNWEPLNIEEVYEATKIRLQNKEWKWYFTNFHAFIDKHHTKECKEKNLWAAKVHCECKMSSALVAIYKAGTFGLPGVARGREFFVNIPHEDIEDKLKLIKAELRPDYVKELIFRGFETLISLLKVYEVTGHILDFGPPHKLYTEDRFKERRYIGEISGDELYAICYEEKDSKKCLEEPSSNQFLLQS